MVCATAVAVSHGGMAQASEIPPPAAPPALPLFQTVSAGGSVALVIVVPPTDVTYGWLAGSSSDRLVATEFEACPAQSSDPSSPAEA